MNMAPSFPPLMQGLHAAGTDPFEAACQDAIQGCDAGTILYDITPEELRAAIVFAPEVPLAKATAMLPLTGVAVQNALGALGPSELPVHLQWDGPIKVNGGFCGRVFAATHECGPDQTPTWMVTGFSLTFARSNVQGGETPDATDLVSEGCGDLSPEQFLESWSRHLLNWINRWEDDGMAPLHREYAGLVDAMGSDIDVLGRSGHFLGLDEDLGLLLRTNGQTTVIPLTELLETRT